MDYVKFFADNKNGVKCNSKWLLKNYPELHKKISDNCNKLPDLQFKEKVYLFLNNLTEPPKCPHCGNYVNYIGNLKKGYNNYCSISCLNKSKDHKEKIKETFQKKYGVNSHNQLESVKQKKKKTLEKNYGENKQIIYEKAKKTLKSKYGVDNPMKIEYVIKQYKEKIKLGEEKNVKKVLDIINDDYIFIEHKNGLFNLKCKKCNKIFEIGANLINSRTVVNSEICLNCNPRKNFDRLPNLILDNINDNIEYILKDRKQIKKEIDIYFPNNKIGIEVNGVYWHSEIYKTINYHKDKTILCEENNIQLLHIFEDEIMHKLEIVQSMINSKLNQCDNKLYARKCEIRELDNNTQVKEFLETNHIQGFVGSAVKIGLFYNNELTSIMTFGKKRIHMGNKSTNEHEYEMLRFCNKLNTQVIGGASKLLKYFIKNYNPKEIISYADRRYSNGSLYEKIGFTKIGYTEPNYWYFKINDSTRSRHHRFKFRKSILVKEGYDQNKTEKEIMNERGYLRIYDCGSIKYQMLL